MQEKEVRSWRTPEFLLVIIMLAVLLILVCAVLFFPANLPARSATTDTGLATHRDILEYRQNILSILITAFGAWIGAGAAYYFGRENLRMAANSLLSMRQPSPRERLRQTLVKQIPLKPLDWVGKASDKVADVWAKLKTQPNRWFIPMLTRTEPWLTSLKKKLSGAL